MVNEARKAAETLAAEGIHARVINIHTIKPLDEDIILKAARECGQIVTAEEHNVIGGLGEAVCSLLSEKLPTPVRRVGVQAMCIRDRATRTPAISTACSTSGTARAPVSTAQAARPAPAHRPDL